MNLEIDPSSLSSDLSEKLLHAYALFGSDRVVVELHGLWFDGENIVDGSYLTFLNMINHEIVAEAGEKTFTVTPVETANPESLNGRVTVVIL